MKVLLELPDDAMEDFARLVAQHLPAASPPPPAAPSVLLPEDVAQVLRCATKRVYELKSRGELPFVKEGGRLVFMRTDVDAYLARNRHITP